jgi:hypothetical protein
MGLFDKIFGINDKIRVQFIDNSDGHTIGISEMKRDKLPETFSIPTTMHIQANDWTVEEAIPENSIDFLQSKSLVLKMRKVEKLNPNDLWYTLPTISNEFPQTTTNTSNTEFDIQILEDDYRQNEFLKMSSIPLIEQEFVGIKNILENFSKKSNDYTLFKNCHVRRIIGEPNLMLNFSELKNILNINSIGAVKINNETLIDSFTFKTENTTYYGTRNNDLVTQFCISKWNENTINEILNINKAYDLVFVNWYHCNIIKND